MKKKFLPFINRRYVPTFGIAGDFTASTHLEWLLKAEEKWAEGKFRDNLRPHVDSLIKQLTEQTARFTELDNPNKDNVVNLTWLKSCGIETTDLNRATDICDVDGTQLESEGQEYEMTMGQKIGFDIDEEKIRTGTYEFDEQVAHIMLKADKELSEWWNAQLLMAYKSFAGPNIPAINGVAAPFTWDDAEQTTDIPAGSYNVEIVANLIQQQILNMVETGWYINNGTLFQAWKNAGLNSGNLDGKGNDARTQEIDLTFDMWNFAKAGITEDMFLIDRNAVALKTYTRYTDTPVVKGGTINQTRYRMKSNILPDTYWDVIYTLRCEAGHDIHTWQFMTAGGIFLNPEPCPTTIGGTEYTPTGVYSFTRTA